jgi:hypothetical protein
MLLKFLDPSKTGYGVIENTSYNNITITGLQPSNGIVYGQIPGATVWKIGRTSGVTWGTLNSGCVDEQIDGLYEICAEETSVLACHGDSGGPVYVQYDPNNPNQTPRVVGLTMAIVAQPGANCASTMILTPIAWAWGAGGGVPTPLWFF